MSAYGYEVPDPILNSPYEEPAAHWYIREGHPPEKRPGRRPSLVYPPSDERSEAKVPWDLSDGTLRPSEDYAPGLELVLVNLLRDRVKAWREAGYPGVTRTTLELLQWWRREGRETRLFFAQLEAAETILFLIEARADFLQGIEVPQEKVSPERQALGYTGFRRYAVKLATGAGKTTVMGMLAAWSILNKVNDRHDPRFSDVVLVVCPNVTIRSRLQELDPRLGKRSLYRTRDLVPEHLMPLLAQGRVLIYNWHVFEPHALQVNGESARVIKAGKPVRVTETIHIGPKTTTARGSRYLTLGDFERQVAAGMLTVLEEERDRQGNLKKVRVESVRYVESEAAFIERVLGLEVGGKQNILVFNDEAHHAYRTQTGNGRDEDAFGERDEAEAFFREATVWVDGLDRIHKARTINFCVDLSATPFYLAGAGRETNRPFPWIVSDFGLVDAIESGLVKIPQLAVRDTTGAEIPGYFHIWNWVLRQLQPGERGAGREDPKPEAILKYAHHPIAMLAGLWEEERGRWEQVGRDRPPVFIVVCKTTRLAKVIYEWLAEDKAPPGIPPARIEGFRNRDGIAYTIRVDTAVVRETDTGQAKSDEERWMRFTLDTVGKTDWPRDDQGRPVYPDGFEELAKKLGRPLHPPGRDVRCIVSVGMLTEGWDCTSVTHIVGLRPFMSQLLCEQVVGRALRRPDYEVGPDGKFTEEVAKVFGVPFQIIPFKANPRGIPTTPVKRHHVYARPDKARYEIRYPRVEGYTQAIRNRITVDWDAIAPLSLHPERIPPEVEMKALSLTNSGRMSLSGPGRLDRASLEAFRATRRLQELLFDMARDLARFYLQQPTCTVPAHVLFPQILAIVRRYVSERVRLIPPADIKDLFLAPYYGWAVERLLEAIRPDTSEGEAPEVPRYETHRGPGSTAEVSFWTTKDVREALKCHLNYVVLDTGRWEQSAAYFIDQHQAVAAFVKNQGLGFSIPYLHDGRMHDYVPDFLIRLLGPGERYLILEVKGYDALQEVKRAAAERWVRAVNADGRYGYWQYAIAKHPTEVPHCIDEAAARFSAPKAQVRYDSSVSPPEWDFMAAEESSGS